LHRVLCQKENKQMITFFRIFQAPITYLQTIVH
jgi:hypothetical protein